MKAGRVTSMQIAVLLLIVGLSTTVFAHHSQSQFDTSTVLAVEGTFTAIQWSNPHTIFFFSGKPVGQDAAVQRWELEGPSAIALQRTSWTKADTKIGGKAIVTGNPRRDGKPELLLTSVTLENGIKHSFRAE